MSSKPFTFFCQSTGKKHKISHFRSLDHHLLVFCFKNSLNDRFLVSIVDSLVDQSLQLCTVLLLFGMKLPTVSVYLEQQQHTSVISSALVVHIAAQ